MIHYCVLPIALTTPHCKIPELSLSHVLHLLTKSWEWCSMSVEDWQLPMGGFSQPLSASPAVLASVPVLCNIQSWLNSL